MKYISLTIPTLLKGKIGNVVNKFWKNKESSIPPFAGLRFVKDITPPYSIGVKKYRVSIYKNEKGKKIVIKQVNYTIQNLDAIYVKNEAFLLKTLSEAKTRVKISPKFIDFKVEKNQIALLTEFVDGILLEHINSNTRFSQVVRSLSILQEISEELKKENFRGLPVRKPFYYLFSFPLNLVRVILKNPSEIEIYIKSAIVFYDNYFQVAFGNVPLGLVHRDFYPDNILIDSKTKAITITDWESAVVSDSLYDLAQVAMIYTEETGTKRIMEVLEKSLQAYSDRRRFIGLAVFNSIQILNNNPVTHPVFAQTERFLNVLMSDMSPQLIRKKSPFEIINAVTLNAVYLFYKITKLPKFSINKKIILCYHSIGNTGWRFSTKVEDFKKQLHFLRKHYKLVSLHTLLSDEKGGVHLTFDDGYKDVMTNALPLIEKIKVKATMFVLADYKKADRTELDNSLEIIDYNQVQFLRTKGWEIGCHTKTHANLANITDSQLQEEIIGSKKLLEKKLGFPVKYFAYPKGIYSNRIVDFVEKAGYKAAFTVDGFDIKVPAKTTMLYSRIGMEGELTNHQFEAMLSPLGLQILRFYSTLLKCKERYLKKKVNERISYKNL